MTRYVATRLAGVAGVLLVICAVTFTIFYVFPADPALQACGKSCTPERLAMLHHQMGLDRPLWRQFADYLGGIFAGRSYGSGPQAVPCHFPCLGFSYQNNMPVWDLMMQRLPTTVSIGIGAAVLWLAGGVTVGVVSALRKDSLLDRTLMVGTLTSASLPIYFTAMALTVLVVQIGGLLPYSSYVPFAEDPATWAKNLVLPWVALALLYAAMYARLSRASMVETMAEPYIRTARAKGLPERTVVAKHGLRAGLTPVLTVFGMDLGALLGGALITESVFGLPGIGRLTIDSIDKSDQPVVMGVALLAAFFITFANLVVDLLYAAVDPQVRFT
ncbi:peptide/nickel transport system permease protein [Actinomadura luteofluorescens]|uniref:Peptide/nickel transport system permease protein n=2 Tax=Actinomadura luteofluorescens TaxID=46163 RepID=A0A7Y9EMC9_9ACTN|nr:ABC transporter permease [Actinomadura luteofluorescens]NYD50445.1 peptide/nickel transport system permease protein [Actinomadura luteofluorescens]